jgi:hypothetical protein
MEHGAQAGRLQQAAGSIEEGVRSQNSESRRKNIKTLTPYWLLTTGYFDLHDLNGLNNGQDEWI